MDSTCQRCHQTVPPESCFCPACGLPQLVYASDESGPSTPSERWTEAARDASVVEWRPALRWAALFSLPAGLLFCVLTPAGFLSLFWIAAAAAWVVVMYVRRQRPAWITLGAGARIGLVTGLLTGWLVLAIAGASLFAMRYVTHQGASFDGMWLEFVNQRVTEQWQSMGVEPQVMSQGKAMLLSPEGRAGCVLAALAMLEAAMLVFAAAGGALGARILARARRPQV